MKNTLATLAAIAVFLLTCHSVHAETLRSESSPSPVLVTIAAKTDAMTATFTPVADGKVKVVFRYIPARREDSLKQVAISGEFNKWGTTELKKDADGTFIVTLEFKSGTYQWKYLLDGKWIQDMETVADRIAPKPDRFVTDPYGGRNCQNDFIVK